MSHNSILKTLVIVLAIMQITACGSVANFTSKDTFQGIRIGDKAELIRFPITYYTNDETPVVLLTSPLIFTDTELYEGEHTRLIPWLNSRGFTVFLVRPSKGRDLNDLSSALPEALREVRELSRGHRIVLGGLSLGGQAALEFLLTESAETRFLSRVFFLGTGFDYEYPGSFLRRMADEKWPGSCSSATSLCSLYLQSKEEKGRSLRPENMQNAKLNFDSQKSVLRRLSLPAAFIGGKIDSLAPTEAWFNTFKTYGEVSRSTQKLYFAAGEDNFLSTDYDHAMLFSSKSAASEIFPIVQKWVLQTK